VALERPAFHAERVRERVEELRVNHDCVVHHWAYRHGGGYCEGCNSHLPSFMMVSERWGLVFAVVPLLIRCYSALHELPDSGVQALFSQSVLSSVSC
jgi:hypothetical protein